MREWTKSMFSYTWAMSLFGAQQMLNVLSPSKAVKSFDEVTSATEGELGRSLQSAFRAGDELQRRMIDLMFAAVPAGGGRGAGNANAGRGQTTASAGAGQPGQPGQQTAPDAPAGPASGPSPYAQPGGGGWGAMPLSSPGTRTPPPPPRRDESQQQPGQIPHESDISPDYPFAPHYVEVFGSRMHYIEEGRGEPIVFLHGNPTWSYLWRNVIPHLSPYGRCIAPDLMGYGRSDKPDIEYRWAEQARYVDEFFKQMGLRNVTLVLHDWGVSLGLNYALRHEQNVRAIAFMEGIFRPFPRWEDFSTPEFRALFQQFREGGEGGAGWQMLVEQNFFIEHLLSGGVGRQLSEEEMAFYREPFGQTRSRIPIWRLARSVPVAGEPKEVWDAISDITERLKRSRLPKLMFYGTPGGIITEENVDWCRRNLKNLETISVGPGVHYVQETTPHLIGSALANWYNGLSRGR